MRLGFAEALKAIPVQKKDSAKNTLAHQPLEKIAAIYHLDNELAQLSPSERKRKRNLTIKVLVEDYFVWLKGLKESNTLLTGKTLKGVNYSINHEKQLRLFLEDGEVPLDNNATEGALRSFCIHKHLEAERYH